MPVYLFTFHAYRSWMPDHPRGYTVRAAGQQAPDPFMARLYVDRARHAEARFPCELARKLIDELLASALRTRLRLQACATADTHLHVLVSWADDRCWMAVRRSLKISLSRRFRSEGIPGGLSRGGSRKRVRDWGHFGHLMTRYLPDHPGIGWYEDRGWTDG
jgi:hypothetical protein